MQDICAVSLSPDTIENVLKPLRESRKVTEGESVRPSITYLSTVKSTVDRGWYNTSNSTPFFGRPQGIVPEHLIVLVPDVPDHDREEQRSGLRGSQILQRDHEFIDTRPCQPLTHRMQRENSSSSVDTIESQGSIWSLNSDDRDYQTDASNSDEMDRVSSQTDSRGPPPEEVEIFQVAECRLVFKGRNR